MHAILADAASPASPDVYVLVDRIESEWTSTTRESVALVCDVATLSAAAARLLRKPAPDTFVRLIHGEADMFTAKLTGWRLSSGVITLYVSP